VYRRTKIVCTLGPATPDRIRELIQAGMDVARLNFSHGDREDHKRVYDMIRHAVASEGHAVGILADLQGPKIRLGRFAAGPTEWRTGEEVRITVDDVLGTGQARADAGSARVLHRVTAAVTDRGRWSPERRTVDPGGYRGHGLAVMTALMQRVHWQRSAAGTTVVLVGPPTAP